VPERLRVAVGIFNTRVSLGGKRLLYDHTLASPVATVVVITLRLGKSVLTMTKGILLT
jgi:hypothetical protein